MALKSFNAALLCVPELEAGLMAALEPIPEHKTNSITQINLQQAARQKRLRKQEKRRLQK